MKTKDPILVIAVLLFAVACNKPTGCNMNELYESEQNIIPEKCDYCINYASSEIPFLNHDDYNSALVVEGNFKYYVKKETEYPYFSHNGDTIKMFGFIMEESGDTLLLSNHKTPPIGGSYPVIVLIDTTLQSANIDKDKECYVTGILRFPSLGNISFSDEKCQQIPFDFYVIDIHN